MAADLQGLEVELDIARQLYSGTVHTRSLFDPWGNPNSLTTDRKIQRTTK
jgi:hypothetical protein